jgi:hypothetical protein
MLFALRIGLAVIAAKAAVAVGAAEAPGAATAEAVYAAFTINLTRFISWPEAALGAPGTPLTIGTFAQDPINVDLDAAARGESVGTHPLRTMRLRNLNEIRDCQVVFVSRGVANIAAVLARTGHRPILTISDAEGFLAGGGHVLFVPQPPHTRLEISAQNLRASGLEARAQLLRIAATP